jgi:hypothetical protein
LQRLLRRFEALSDSFAAYWPGPEIATRPAEMGPMVAASVSAVETWSAAAAPVIESLRALESERADLALWLKVLAQIKHTAIDLRWTIEAGLNARCSVSLETAIVVPAAVLIADDARESGVLAAGSRRRLPRLRRRRRREGKRVAVHWLWGSADESLELVTQRLSTVDAS